MKFDFVTAFCASALALSVLASSASAITLGQIDDFQDGGVAAWIHAAPAPMPPFNVPNSGPMGAGDNSLEVDALGGGGPGSRLLMRNTNQWAGDYTGAGVTAIEADMLNLNTVPLLMRFAVEGNGGRFASTDPIVLVPGMGWESVIFPISAADFSPVDGGFNVDLTLSTVSEVRVLHSAAPDWRGAVIDADFQIDNILASQAVPEPSTIVLLAFAAIGACIATTLRRR